MHKVAIFLAFAGTLALAGCNNNGRPLSYDKGVYGGKADTKLTAEQVEALRQRGMRSYQ